MKDVALLVVDVQRSLIAYHPYREKELLKEIWALIDGAHATGVEVVYVRHNEDTGDELVPNTPGWEIHEAIAPAASEKIFDKWYSSAFKDTELDEYLRGRGVKTLVIAGMQTEYCIDATIKSAFERGYNVVMPEGGSTTYDNSFSKAEPLIGFYERLIWNNRFADVMPLDDALLVMAQ